MAFDQKKKTKIHLAKDKGLHFLIICDRIIGSSSVFLSDGLCVTEFDLTLSEINSVISCIAEFIWSSVDKGRRMKGLDSISTLHICKSVRNIEILETHVQSSGVYHAGQVSGQMKT